MAQQGLMVSAALGGALVALVVTPAMAQSMPPPPPPAGDSALNEVIVTASRRSESVYAIPSNITAITGADLAATGVTDISGISRLVPGLGLFDEGARDSGNRNNFSLRGLNANEAFNEDDNPSKTQDTVSTYLGETPIFFPFKLVDIDRVEVLRGPQGTLYGSGSVGGTIRFIPNKPNSAAPYFDVSAEAAGTKDSSDPSYDFHGTANLPLADNAAVRFTGGYERQGGWIDDNGLIKQTGTAQNPGPPVLANPADPLTSGAVPAPPAKDYNDSRLLYFRGAAIWRPDSTLEFDLSYVFQKNDAGGRNEDNPYFGSDKSHINYNQYLMPQTSKINLEDLDISKDFGFASVTSTTSLSDVQVRSVSDSSAFERTNLAQFYFGFPRLYAPLIRDQNKKTFTEEARLVSKSGDNFDWIVGGYYSRQSLSYTIEQTAWGVGDYTEAVLGTPSGINFGDILVDGGTNQVFSDRAGFGELTWHITPKLQLTGGTRVFDQDTKGTSGTPLPFASLTTEYFINGQANNPFLLGGIVPFDVKSTGTIFKANASYTFSKAALLYAMFSQGFRAGGSNALPATDPFGDNNRPFLTYRPDKVNNYEVGLKGESTHLPIEYSVTAFFEDWSNFQTALFTPFGVGYIANVPRTTSKGVEAQFKIHPTTTLTIGLGYTYVDARTASDFDLVAEDPTTLVPSGTRLPGSSSNNATATADYVIPLSGPWSEIILHGDASYKSGTASNFMNFPNLLGNSYVEFPSIKVLNVAATLRRGAMNVTLFAKNLTSDRGTTLANSAQAYGQQDQGYGVIRPLNVGLRLAWATR